MQRALAVLLLVSLLHVPSATAQTDDLSVRPVEIPSWDGTVLTADLYWSAAAEATPAPAILMTHGWGGSKADLVDEARWLAGLGHIVLAYDSRGFGGSEGTVGLNGPDEWADASHLVDWLAALQGDPGPRVRLDDAAAADPRVGMYGYSYGGAIQLLAAAQDARIDAIAPDITWHDLETSLAPNGVVKRGWVDLLFWGGILGAHGARSGQPNSGGMDARLQEWYLAALQTGRFPAEASPALEERSPAVYLEEVGLPVLLMQGWRDTLFPPDQALATYTALDGREEAATHLLLHPGGHGHALDSVTSGHVRQEVERFFARHLSDRPVADVADVPAVQWFDTEARTWRSADTWPVAATRPLAVAFEQMGRVTLAQAPAATSHTETQEAEGTLGSTGPEPATPLPTTVRVPVDVPGPAAFLGAPVLRLNVTPSMADATLFFSLLDVGLDGRARVIGNQVQPVRLEGAAGAHREIEVQLVSLAHTLQVGHSLELRVATSDSAFIGSREPGTVLLDLPTATLELPLLDRAALEVPQDGTESAAPQTQGSPGAGPGVGLGLLVLLIGVAARGRPRRD